MALGLHKDLPPRLLKHLKTVSMKIVVIDNNSHISIRPDSAMLRNNDTFYLPTFSNDIVCDYGYVVRITRLAKCVAQKFASRCYDSVTAGVTFIARDIIKQAVGATLPTDEAYCFDHSTAIGTEWFTPEQLTGKSSLSLHIGEKEDVTTHANLLEVIDRNISVVSNKLTLKTGDLVFIASNIANEVKATDSVIVTLNNSSVLDFQIK